jgi:altronate dehydratase
MTESTYCCGRWRKVLVVGLGTNWRTTMSKGMNQKKQEKKKPTKTLDEKRAAKKAKKAARAFIQQS